MIINYTHIDRSNNNNNKLVLSNKLSRLLTLNNIGNELKKRHNRYLKHIINEKSLIIIFIHLLLINFFICYGYKKLEST